MDGDRSRSTVRVFDCKKSMVSPPNNDGKHQSQRGADGGDAGSCEEKDFVSNITQNEQGMAGAHATKSGSLSESSTESLSNDYAEIAKLMEQLDDRLGDFVKQMNRLQDQVPVQVGLASLWEEQAKAMTHAERPQHQLKEREKSLHKSGTKKSPIILPPDLTIGDGSVSDKLVFL